MLATVKGQKEVQEALARIANASVAQVRLGVEVTTQQVVIAAQANHTENAHSVRRYQNQTTLLTNSMRADIVKQTPEQIVGQASANREYASDVELGTPQSRAYPYMYPALMTDGVKLQTNIAIAMGK